MNLKEDPEILVWPETDYVFVEKIGPFQFNAPQAWTEAHKLLDGLMKHNKITGYLSLYKVVPQIYRAGFALETAPRELPAELRYEKFNGGKYSRFVLTGSYSQLGLATGRVFEIMAEKGIAAAR